MEPGETWICRAARGLAVLVVSSGHGDVRDSTRGIGCRRYMKRRADHCACVTHMGPDGVASVFTRTVCGVLADRVLRASTHPTRYARCHLDDQKFDEPQ